jgi:pyruvate kinase
MNRRAKIVATIGPACWEESMLRALLQAGVNVARLNFSHGTHEDHATVIARLRKVSAGLERSVCLLQDLQGPKIRTGDLLNGPVTLVAGEPLTLTTEPAPGDAHLVPVDFPELTRSARVGKPILLDDGTMELLVTAIHETSVETKVIEGGVLKSHKGINLPGSPLEIPGFTEKDEADLIFGLKQGVDAVAVSFVSSESDILKVRQAIQRIADEIQRPDAAHTPIIAKLERPEALECLEAIIAAADGVMVARGDLGVEMPAEHVPVAQKRIIECANRQGKVVITATQMLDSMIHSPRPTRAEASDVANAIFDGSDAVMLSGETASGEYPLKAVEMMDAIVCQAEEHMATWGRQAVYDQPSDDQDDAFFVTRAAKELAHDRNVAAIGIFTHSGRTAAMMAKARPGVPILAFTPRPEVYSRLQLYWGVMPHLTPQADTIAEMLSYVESVILKRFDDLACRQVVLVCGYPLHAFRSSNMALLHTIGDQQC